MYFLHRNKFGLKNGAKALKAIEEDHMNAQMDREGLIKEL